MGNSELLEACTCSVTRVRLHCILGHEKQTAPYKNKHSFDDSILIEKDNTPTPTPTKTTTAT